MKRNLCLILLALFTASSFFFSCLCIPEAWESSLLDKVCPKGVNNTTTIREQVLKENAGYYNDMLFNTPDRVYLFWDQGITIYNINDNSLTSKAPPLRNEREYMISHYALSKNNECVIGGIYRKLGQFEPGGDHPIVFFIDADFNFHDITPAGHTGREWSFAPFFYNGYLYLAARYDTYPNPPPSGRNSLKRYSYSSGVVLRETVQIDVAWGFDTYITKDNLVWACDSNKSINPATRIFSFDGTEFTYYGPNAKYLSGGQFPLDRDNIYLGSYSGVFYSYKEGVWTKHNICKEDEPGYNVENIWAGASDNIFVAGSSDTADQNNFAYHFDGVCWTRFYKRNGIRNINKIWGNDDASVVLAVTDTGTLLRLYVER